MEISSKKDIAVQLGNFAVQMQAQPDVETTLRAVVASASDILAGVSWAGISLVRGKRVTSEAPTDEVASALDRLQSEVGEGPAIDALADERTIVITDLGAETRWPLFTTAAVARGVRCLASFRLYVDDGNLGALTLYGPRPNTFNDDTIMIGEILAQHAAVAIAGAKAEDQLSRAVAGRDIIGQAKGILMYREKVTSLQAFAALTKASQETNVKVIDVARLFVSDFEQGLGQNGR